MCKKTFNNQKDAQKEDAQKQSHPEMHRTGIEPVPEADQHLEHGKLQFYH
jgi:hypothetical protein